MLAALRPRGPDGEERLHAGSLGIVSTSLDVGDSRLTPCTARVDDRFVVVGQVRIDDRETCVRRLAGAGQRVTTESSDVMLFAHGWAAFGESFLEWVLGDYAVIVHDVRDRVTTMVRDPFGVRMLYYAVSRERVTASNTLAAVLASPGVSRELNDDAIADFIAVGLNSDVSSTSYRGIQRVPPGHLARIGAEGDARLTRWWRLPELREIRRRSDADYVDGFRTVLEASVRDRLRGSSAAVMMSGGLDSTALASIASRLLPGQGNVGAATVKSATAYAGEMERARSVVSMLGLSHRVIDAEEFDCMSALGDPTLATPEPFDEPDLAILRALLRSSGDMSRVVLYGEDPDTILSPPDLPELLIATAPWRLASDILRYLVHTRMRPHLGIRNRLRSSRARAREAERVRSPSWLAPELSRRREQRLAASQTPTHRTRPQVAHDIAQPLWQSVLESLDAGVHRIPLDVRLPYIDRRVIDYALTVPAIPWLQHKRILRDAMAGALPDDVRLAPKRGAPGTMEHRVRRWWSANPSPFVPSAELATFVDVAALPEVGPESDQRTSLEHLRLRILDRWLRDHAQSGDAALATRLQNPGR